MGDTTKIEWAESGRQLGVQKSAAAKVGCSLAQWRRHHEEGRRWCYRCRKWEPVSEFAKDRTRSTGYSSACRPCNNHRSTRSRYSLSETQFSVLKSSSACAICHREGQKMEVDHDHKTGAVREMLCSRCNKALGQFDDDKQLMVRAIAYLEKHGG